MAQKVSDDRLSGWLQRPTGEPVNRGSPARMNHTDLSVGGSLPHMGAAGERPEFDIKPPIGAPLLLNFPRGYFQKSFPQGDNSARLRGIKIRVFPHQGELTKSIEPHLPVFQSYRWIYTIIIHNTVRTIKSLDPIVATALRLGFPEESFAPTTCGFACNCPVPEAWTTEASGRF